MSHSVMIRITTDDLMTFDVSVSPDFWQMKKGRKQPLFQWHACRREGLSVTSGIGKRCTKKYRSHNAAMMAGIAAVIAYAEEHAND